MPARRSTTPAVLSLWALAATVVALQACGSNGESPAIFQGAGGNDASAQPQCKAGEQGCACPTNGATAACGEVVTKNGSYVTCSMGTSTCEGGAWGPCKGNTIVVKSQHAVKLGGSDTPTTPEQFDPLVQPMNCPDPCDPNPNCTTLTGGSSDVDAAGIYPAPEGGVSLGSGDASAGPCTGLQCYVAQCSGGVTTTITGTVTDPAGNVPLYNATVYIPVDPTGAIPAFTTGVSCDQCAGAVPPDAVANTTTDTFGHFTLTGVPSGSGLVVPVVVQMGKWRREILIDNISSCTNNVVTTNCTAPSASQCVFRLPQNQHDGYNPADGTYDHADMPQMAMVTGSADPLECVLLKAGISESEFSSYKGTNSTPSAHVHMFESNNAPGAYLDPNLGSNESASTLWADTLPNTIAAPHYGYYDVVLDACEGAAIDKHPLRASGATTVGEPYYNLINYTNAGGRAFLTHYSYVWLQYPSVKGYVSAPNNWNGLATWLASPLTGTVDTQDPLTAYVITAFPKGAAYENWLFNVNASTTLDQLVIHEGRQDLYDPAGTLPSSNTAAPTSLGTGVQPWLNANDSSEPSSKAEYVPHFTFNTPITAPAASQCGRVVFSDFHVSTNSQVGNGNPSCTENSQCGFGQVCTGHPGTNGTCSEPCISNLDCKDSSYSCVGVTAGQCLPTSCQAGTPTYACPGGLVCDTATHTNCLCTQDTQCPSGKCINEGQCGAGPCTGATANGLDPSSDCQLDAPKACVEVCATGEPNATSNPTACWCTSDSQCASDKCVPWTAGTNGCAAPNCTGTGTAQAADHCQPETASISASCAPTTCALGAVSGSSCWCTFDNQCPNGVCVNWSGCTGADCSGSGAFDANHCSTGPTPTCSQASGYVCPIGGGTTCNGSHDCQCTNDSQCPGSKCIPNGQCVSPQCTGSGTADDLGCEDPSALPNPTVATYACPAGQGVCNGADTTCLCTTDSECATGACVNAGQAGCTSATCTGSGAADSRSCATTAPTCTTTVGASCPLGGSTGCNSSLHCQCTNNTECPNGLCVPWAGGPTGCNPGSHANCSGSGTADDLGCEVPTTALGSPTVAGHACPAGQGVCNSGNTACLCTSDSECADGACVNGGQAGCTATTCTGSGAADAHGCATATPTCSTATPAACPLGGATTCNGSNDCQCTNDSECKGNKCIPWAGGPAGCNPGSHANCSGSGTADDLGCEVPSATFPSVTWSCSGGGDVEDSDGQCWCTSDSQCATGACVNSGQTGCTATTCTGSGSVDTHNCATTQPTCSGSNYTCPDSQLSCTGASCSQCTSDSQCQASGRCASQHGSGCNGGVTDAIGCCEDGSLGSAPSNGPIIAKDSCPTNEVCYEWSSNTKYCACTTSSQCGDYSSCYPAPLTGTEYSEADWLDCAPRPETWCSSAGSACGGGGTCDGNFAQYLGTRFTYLCCDGTQQYDCAGHNGSSCGSGVTCNNVAGGYYCYAAGACECTNDNQCGTGSLCVNFDNQCSGNNCTGNGHNNYDNFGCTNRSETTCSPSTGAGYCSLGTENSGGTKCVCNQDADCNAGKCASNNPGCTGTNCTGASGQGGTDGCVTACTGNFTCSDPHYTCTTGSGNCPGATGTALTDTPAASCSAGFSPNPATGGVSANTECWCTQDSQCASLKCVNNGQAGYAGTGTATGPGNGAGQWNTTTSCLNDSVTVCNAPTYVCSDTRYSSSCTTGSGSCPGATGTALTSSCAVTGYTCAIGTPIPATGTATTCYCNSDSQCPSQKCFNQGQSGCTGTTCTGAAPNGSGNGAGQWNASTSCVADAVTACNAATNTCSDPKYTCGAQTSGTCPGATGTALTSACTASTYACAVGSPFPATGTATECLCTNDSQCASLKCVNHNGQCTGTNCSGSGTNFDVHDCELDAVTACTPPVYVCSDTKFSCTTGSGTCTGVVPGGPLGTPTYACTTGTCNAADTNCLCTNDSQCGNPLKKCVPTTVNGTPTCNSATCTGTGTNVDANNCEVPSSLPTPDLTCPSGVSGTCNGADNCICNADSQCHSGGLCVNVGQLGCTSATCTGTGAANDRGCQEPTQTLPVGCTTTIAYSCSSGMCNAAGTACLCTADNQCPSGQCIPTTVNGTPTCTSATCTGTGAGDAASCVPSTVTNCSNPPPPNGTNAQCGGPTSVELCSTPGDGGGPGLGQCQKACTNSTQCTGGEQCVGGFCHGCNSASNCYDRVYPKTCNGASGAVSGNCCGNGSPIPTTTCGTNNGLFPEECLQTPLTDQEKALEFMFFDLTSCVTPDTGPVTTPVLLTAKSFTLEFTASCPSGSRPRWREFDYQASFPANATGTYTATYPDNSIDFAAQTGGGYPTVNDAGGAFIPATPLQLGSPVTTNTTGWVDILLDTAPGGTGLFTTATPTIVSQVDLLMTVTLTPTADQLSSPTLLAWRAEYDCPPSE